MGMFDEIICSHPLPTQPPAFVGDGHRFQTKDLECELALYEIAADGRLVLHPRDGSVAVAVAFHGELSFRTSNLSAGWGEVVYTRDGSDYESVEYAASFVGGRVQSIKETSRERTPALPSNARERPRRTREEINAAIAKRQRRLIGQRLFSVWGHQKPSDGKWVKVIAENDHQLVLEDEGGGFDVAHRQQLGSSLFDTPGEAAESENSRRAEYAQQLAMYKQLVEAGD